MNVRSSSPGKAHYGHNYESKKRLASYWHQVDECVTLGGSSVLVVGKGSGLPAILLEKRGFEVITLDIQPDVEPTVIGDVRELPFSEKAFDISVCCEVLEHMPFKYFLPSLCELKRIVRRGLVLSLPDRGRWSKVIPYIFFRRSLVMDLPNIRLQPWKFNGEHFWEVNTQGHAIQDIERTFVAAGLKVEHSFRVWETPYHHFWRLTIR